MDYEGSTYLFFEHVPFLDKDLPHNKSLVKRKYGVSLYPVEKYKAINGQIWGELRKGGSLITARWDLYFEYPCESFKTFCLNIRKRQVTLYLCLRKTTIIPKEVIKIIVNKMEVYEGPFFTEKRPTTTMTNWINLLMLILVSSNLIFLYFINK
jgi:hypothetical protein